MGLSDAQIDHVVAQVSDFAQSSETGTARILNTGGASLTLSG